MYCSSCGTEVTRELNYCNRCGAKLNAAGNEPEPPVRVVSLNGPFWAMAIMVMVGLIAIISGSNELANKGLHPAALTWIVLGCLGMLIGALALFMRQLSQLGGAWRMTDRAPKKAKAEKDEQRPPQLPPARMEPVPSVTEHTTRTFEPAAKSKRYE